MAASVSARIPGTHDPVARAASIKRTNEEMRARIAELKAQLEDDRARTRQLHRNKVRPRTKKDENPDR